MIKNVCTIKELKMKKKVLIILFLSLLISLCLIMTLMIYNNKKEFKMHKRYDEIKENVKKGVEWQLRANYPKCPIGDKYEKKRSSHSNSSYLINQGFIKKEDLLDIDGNSYCDVYVETYTYFKDSLDQQNNCEVNYKIYLKCANYEDNGYINWGWFKRCQELLKK